MHCITHPPQTGRSHRLCTIAWFLAVLCLLTTGCGISVYHAQPFPSPVDGSFSAITRGLHYLQSTQVTAEEEARTGGDIAGNWPQYFQIRSLPEFSVREVSPFTPAFIHHSLTLVTAANAPALGLLPAEIDAARHMRRQTITFMKRFEAKPDDPAAGTIGFWPDMQPPATLQDQFLAAIFLPVFGGPTYYGTRSPLNISFYPPPLAMPTDADDTAMVYSAFLNDAQLDGGAGANASIDRYFSDWRDLGQAPRWLNPSWLPQASGAFLTWLAYNDPPGVQTPNDVDLVVNANVLYVLARYGHLDTPGVAEAIGLINSTTLAGYHESRPNEVTLYYPPNHAYHYCISRAYHEGPVPGLAPATERLADELEATVRHNADGTAFWDRGDPHLNTAFAVLALLNAGRPGQVVDQAIEYLLSQQDPVFGNWEDDVFFAGVTETGVEFVWRSSALTTAIVLEALCRHRLVTATDS